MDTKAINKYIKANSNPNSRSNSNYTYPTISQYSPYTFEFECEGNYKFLLEIGSLFIRTEAELVLKSRNVIPKRLLENGFEFKFGSIDETFRNLIP
ncbi:DUF1731 domain-containing protein [Flavobacterium fluviatile]|uniref:DUF1731 domain-containing protein n=1 Tax=Flavobacterium fluviatile TaxID=1862387 RepID=UPI003137D39B